MKEQIISRLIQAVAVSTMIVLMAASSIPSDTSRAETPLDVRTNLCPEITTNNEKVDVERICVPIVSSSYESDTEVEQASQMIEEVRERIEKEPVSDILEEPIEVVEEESTLDISEEDIRLIALVTMAEAEGECEEGQRLVIDTILNRVDHDRFPDTVNEVVYQESQFTSMSNGRINKCYVMDDIYNLVVEELQSRTNYDVIYFTAGKYGKYGTPMFPVGNHYFASY